MTMNQLSRVLASRAAGGLQEPPNLRFRAGGRGQDIAVLRESRILFGSFDITVAANGVVTAGQGDVYLAVGAPTYRVSSLKIANQIPSQTQFVAQRHGFWVTTPGDIQLDGGAAATLFQWFLSNATAVFKQADREIPLGPLGLSLAPSPVMSGAVGNLAGGASIGAGSVGPRLGWDDAVRLNDFTIAANQPFNNLVSWDGYVDAALGAAAFTLRVYHAFQGAYTANLEASSIGTT